MKRLSNIIWSRRATLSAPEPRAITLVPTFTDEDFDVWERTFDKAVGK